MVKKIPFVIDPVFIPLKKFPGLSYIKSDDPVYRRQC